MKTKYTSSIRAAAHSLFGAFLLISANALAQNLFVADNSSQKILEFTPGGVRSTFASLVNAQALAFNSTGDLFASAGNNIYEYTPGGVRSTFASAIGTQGLAINSAGDLFVSAGNNIYEYTPGGTRSIFASGLSDASYLAFNVVGDLFVATTPTNGTITEITPGGVRSTFASGLGEYRGLAFDSAGNLFATTETEIYEFTPAGAHSTFASGVFQPSGLALNNAGNLFVGVGVVDEFTPGGARSTFVTGVQAWALAFQGVNLPVPEPSVLDLLAVSTIVFIIRQRTPEGTPKELSRV